MSEVGVGELTTFAIQGDKPHTKMRLFSTFRLPVASKVVPESYLD